MSYNARQIKLLETTSEVIAQRGIKGASVREICSKAGMNVAMVSYYFGSKEGLIEALFDYTYETAKQRVSLLMDTTAGAEPEMQLRELIQYLVREYLAHSYFISAISNEVRAKPKIQERVQSFYNVCIQRIEHITLRGIDKGIFHNAVKPENILSTILGMILFVLRNEEYYRSFLENTDKKQQPEYIYNKLSTHLYDMIRTQLEHKIQS